MPCALYKISDIVLDVIIFFPFFFYIVFPYILVGNWSKGYKYKLLKVYKELLLASLAPCRPMQVTLLIQCISYTWLTHTLQQTENSHVHIRNCRLNRNYTVVVSSQHHIANTYSFTFISFVNFIRKFVKKGRRWSLFVLMMIFRKP